MKKLFVLGLDGETWELLDWAISKGAMPTLAAIKKKSSVAKLESVKPAVSSTCWISIATGKNPGKTGAYDFLNRKPNSYDFSMVNSNDYRGQFVWDLLNKNNLKAGVVNFNVLYPAYPIDGFVIPEVVLLNKLETFPKELRAEVKKISDGYEKTIEIINKFRYNFPGYFFKDVLEIIKSRGKIINYLMEKKEWDLFFVVMSMLDPLHHFMWKFFDKEHPYYDENKAKKYKPMILDVYRAVDGIIADIVKLDANLMVLSDHGSGGHFGIFNLGTWLAQKGYVVPGKTKRRLIPQPVRDFIADLIPKFILKRIVDRSKPASIIDSIDIRKSKAICLGHTIGFGAIYINLKSKFPHGCVDDSEFEHLRSKIIAELKQWAKLQKMKIDIVNKSYYTGKFADIAPHIVFYLNDMQVGVSEDKLFGEIFEMRTLDAKESGLHSSEGMFLAHGPDIKDGDIGKINSFQIAPTILHMFNCAVPDSMDGRVMTEIFNPDSEISSGKTKYYNETAFDDEKEKLDSVISKLKI